MSGHNNLFHGEAEPMPYRDAHGRRSRRRTLNTLQRTLLSAIATGVIGTMPAPALAQAQDADLRPYYSGNGLLSRGLYEQAIEEYRTFLDRNPDHEKADVARYGLAVAYSRLNRHQECLAVLAEIDGGGDFPYAAETIALDAQSRFTMGDFAGAATAFQRLLNDYPQSDPADDGAAMLVESLHRAGQYDQTDAAFAALLNNWPASPLLTRAEFFEALSLMQRERYADAAERLQAVLQREPEGALAPQATLLRAQCLHHASMLGEAIRGYRRVVEQFTGDLAADAQLGLGGALLTKGQPAEAARSLDQFLAEHPDHPEAARARILRGRAAFDMGEYDDAAARLAAASEASRGADAETEYWLAKSLLRSGDPGSAAQRLTRAVRRFGDSPLIAQMQYDLAVAQLRAGEDAEAMATLVEFRQRHPDHALTPQALHMLATLAHRKGDYDASDAYCESFLQTGGEGALADEIAFLRAENALLDARFDDAATLYAAYLQRPDASGDMNLAHFRLGDALHRIDRDDEARVQLEMVAGLADERAAFRPALRWLGDMSFAGRQWADAQALYERFLAFGWDQPNADDAALRLGLALQRQDEQEAAVAIYDRLLREAPDSPHHLQATFERGQALLALERYDEAAAAFEQTLAEGPDSRFAPYALNHLGTIALQNEDYDAAADRFAQATAGGAPAEIEAGALLQRGQALMASAEFDEALGAFEELLAEHADTTYASTARAQRAIALSRLGRHEEAVAAVDSALEDAGALPARQRATLTYEKAWCLRQLDRPDDARRAYSALLNMDDVGDLLLYATVDLAQLETEAGRPEVAAALLEQSVSNIENSDTVAPDLAERARYAYAAALYEVERFADAAARFGQFVESHPESALVGSALLLQGESLVRTGRADAAIAPLERVVGEYGEDDELVRPAMLRLGESYAQAQRWAPSEEVFTRYLERFGDSEMWFQAQFGLGWARENQQRYDEAISAYQQVVSRHEGPTCARAQFQIGESLFAQRKYDEAIRELLKVDILYAYPEWSAAALYEAGRCFEAMTRIDDARAQYVQVRERFPDTQWAALAAERENALPKPAALPGR